jgi:uncharacterized protein with GYD domain
MPTYISLAKWTDQGVRNVKESPQRLDAFKKMVEGAGRKVIGFYLTMGRYDLAVVYKLHSDEIQAAVGLGTASRGSVRTETLKAFPEDQYRGIISKI